jgi:hypothetical protein
MTKKKVISEDIIEPIEFVEEIKEEESNDDMIELTAGDSENWDYSEDEFVEEIEEVNDEFRLCTLVPETFAVKEGIPYVITLQKVTYVFDPPDYTAILPKDVAIIYDKIKHPIVIKE